MEIVVSGRNVEVPEHFRVHVSEKLTRLERYDHKIVGMEVELFHEPNPRQTKSCQRVEITGRGCGPVARAEACGPDFYAALDGAISKLEARLRRAHDRRRVAYGRRPRGSVRTMHGTTALLEEELTEQLRNDEYPAEDSLAGSSIGAVEIPSQRGSVESDGYLPGQIMRQKEHTAKPMSVDDALAEMELVGHDFYLFACVDTGMPSVVYRRKGYDYGVIRLA